MDTIINSLNNKYVKQVRMLSKRKQRWKDKQFVIDGIRAVKDALISQANIEFVLFSADVRDRYGATSLIDACLEKGLKVFEVDKRTMNDVTDTESPQGIMAVVNFEVSHNEINLKDEANFVVILDRVQDPGNMGAIIRTADAFGVDTIVITKGCVDLYNPKTIRSTMGSVFHTDITFYDDNEKLIHDLKKKTVNIMSTTLNADYPCYSADFKESIALIIGNEGSGVCDYFVEACDYTINIPMQGKAESLNAAIASSVVMYEVSRQRKA